MATARTPPGTNSHFPLIGNHTLSMAIQSSQQTTVPSNPPPHHHAYDRAVEIRRIRTPTTEQLVIRCRLLTEHLGGSRLVPVHDDYILTDTVVQLGNRPRPNYVPQERRKYSNSLTRSIFTYTNPAGTSSLFLHYIYKGYLSISASAGQCPRQPCRSTALHPWQPHRGRSGWRRGQGRGRRAPSRWLGRRWREVRGQRQRRRGGVWASPSSMPCTRSWTPARRPGPGYWP